MHAHTPNMRRGEQFGVDCCAPTRDEIPIITAEIIQSVQSVELVCVCKHMSALVCLYSCV